MNGKVTTHPGSEKLGSLIGDLQSDIKTLVTKEIELAKTEMAEKFKDFGKNAAFAAAGGVLGLIALFLLLLALGALFGNLLQRMDFSPGTAYFLSYAGLSLVLGGVAYALVHKALNAFSRLSLSPEKARASIKGAEAIPIEIRKASASAIKVPKPDSDDLRTEVVTTRARMDSEIEELKSRMTPAYMARSLFAGIKHHPLRALLMGASTGLGGYLYWKNRHAVELKPVEASRKWWQFRVRHT